MITDTPMDTLENLSRRVRHPAVKWRGIQRVVDAAINDTNWRGRDGRIPFGGDGSQHREQYVRPRAPGLSGSARDHPRVGTWRERPDDTLVKECSHYSLTKHLDPPYWLKYPHLRPDRSTARPSANTHLTAQGGAQSAPTVPSRVERGAPVGAEGCQNWSASSARNSLARKQGERPGWSDVGGSSA